MSKNISEYRDANLNLEVESKAGFFQKRRYFSMNSNSEEPQNLHILFFKEGNSLTKRARTTKKRKET
jgi:hypothetical protein